MSLLALLLAVPLVASSGAGALVPSGDLPVDESGFERMLIDLSEYEDLTVEAPMHANVPSDYTGIGPGAKLLIYMGGSAYGCTASFIWTDGTDYYLGSAGHCFIPAGKKATHGPGADWAPSGTLVRVCITGCSFGGQSGFIITGAFLTLGNPTYARQTGSGGDLGNDFGIVKIPSTYYPPSPWFRPSMPVWGGPLAPSAYVSLGQTVCHYGNGVGVGEVFATKARAGVGISSNIPRGYWLADTPAAFGDSGSAVNRCASVSGDTGGLHGTHGYGTLTHLTVSTGVVAGTNVPKAISMTSADRGISISVVTGP